MDQALEKSVVRVRGGVATAVLDRVAIERPLQIRVRVGDDERVLSTTMRTPGDDVALAVGFLHAEGVLASAGALLGAAQIDDDGVRVELAPAAAAALAASARSFVTSGACGVCGRASLDGMAAGCGSAEDGGARVAAAVIHALPGALRAAQATFARTGGLHAAALFDARRRAARGARGRRAGTTRSTSWSARLLLAGRLPRGGRRPDASAGARASSWCRRRRRPASRSSPRSARRPAWRSSCAAAAGMTLLGFVRDGGFNVYAAPRGSRA